MIETVVEIRNGISQFVTLAGYSNSSYGDIQVRSHDVQQL